MRSSPFARTRHSALLLALTVAPFLSASEDGLVERVLQQVERSDSLESDLRTLCDEIGPRLIGSDEMRRAEQWAVERFRDAGVDAVELEPFDLPLVWSEGDTRVEVLTPTAFQVQAVSTAWSPATRKRGITAEVLDAGGGSAYQIRRLAETAAGKILLVALDEVKTFHALGVEQRDAIIAMREAAEAGAAAVLFASTRPNRLLYRHVNTVSGDLDPLPSAVATREDALRIQRLLRDGERVTMRLALPNRIQEGGQANNVVAEIRGDEKPEEFVLLGAHLDSWDLGTGCLDNAVNAALTIEAARALHATGERPRRTIRFVLFGAEEAGLIGSRAYVGTHRDELDRYSAVIVHDMGLGRVEGYSLSGRRELEAPLRAALEPVAGLTGGRHTTDAFFGSDHFDFLLEGVPALIAMQDTAEYALSYHSAADTYEKVDLRALKQRAKLAAGAAVGIAEAAEPLGERQSREDIERLLDRTRLDEQMKFLRVWEPWESGRRGRRP